MKIEREFGTYTCTDDDNGVRIIMKDVEPEARGKRNLSAHIEIAGWVEGENRWQEIITARHGISTLNARGTLKAAISKELKGDPKENDLGLSAIFGLTGSVMVNDWYSTIKDVCEGVTKMHYAGNPPIDLYAEDFEESDVWRIPGLLAEDINVVYGKPSSGKSYLSIIWGQAIQNGVGVCGLDTVQGNVLLIDYETTPAKMRKRFKRVDAGLGIEGSSILYIPQSVPLARNMSALRDYVSQYKIDFIIIDSLARAVGGSLTEDDSVNAFFENLRELQRACLIIHHTNRSDEYYGSNFIHAYARSMWRLRSVQSENKLSMQLIQEKENDGAGTGDVGFVLTFEGDPFDPDSVTLHPQDNSVVDGLRRYMMLPKAIEGLLSEVPGHKMLVHEVRESPLLSMGIEKKNTFDNYMWALRNNTGKYKRLAKMMRVDNDYLILNTIEGGFSMNGSKPDPAEPTDPVPAPIQATLDDNKEMTIW